MRNDADPSERRRTNKAGASGSSNDHVADDDDEADDEADDDDDDGADDGGSSLDTLRRLRLQRDSSRERAFGGEDVASIHTTVTARNDSKSNEERNTQRAKKADCTTGDAS